MGSRGKRTITHVFNPVWVVLFAQDQATLPHGMGCGEKVGTAPGGDDKHSHPGFQAGFLNGDVAELGEHIRP